MNKYSEDDILMLADKINATPRKRLGYHTSEELFYEKYKNLFKGVKQ